MKEYYCIRCGKKIKDEKVKTSIAKRKNPKYCDKICRYDKHYEVCHIIPISNFKNEDKMFEVNKPSNLIALCRNCHWEFDHNLMDEFTKELVIKISSSRTKNY